MKKEQICIDLSIVLISIALISTGIIISENGLKNGKLIDTAGAKFSNVPPIANFTWAPTNPTTNDTIQFTDLSTDSDGTIESWYWEFGDGSTAYVANVTHQYADDGLYQVNLTVWDDDRASDTISKNITVSNVPPIADFTFEPANPSTADLVYFNSTSTDSDGNIESWEWEFGDGSTVSVENVTHQYSDDRIYQVNLTVTDDDGATDAISKIVTVSNVPPIANFTWTPTNPDTLDTIQFTDQSNDTDGNITSWYWEFGDGSTDSGENVAHQYADDGTYQVNLTVWDDDGASDTTSKNIIVSNIPPIADFTYKITITSPNFLTVNFTDNSTDPDGSIVDWKWEFGDESNPSYEQNPTHEYIGGIYLANLTVWDNDDGSSTISRNIPIERPSLVYINGNFNSSIPGWKYDHFATIQMGIDAVAQNGTLYVYNGAYYENIVIDKPLTLIGENRDNVFITTNGSGDKIHIITDQVTIKSLTVKGDGSGNGVKIDGSSNKIISIDIRDHSFGIYLINSSQNNQIKSCAVHDNIKGIYLRESGNNTIQNCSFYNNSYCGIEINHHSNQNRIIDCEITNNDYYGIYIWGNSNNNNISHNNFIDNDQNAYDICENNWGSDYWTAGGNYWDDHNNSDQYHGINQDIPDSDGFSDRPYNISGGDNQDRYPLAHPIQSPPSYAWVNDDFTNTTPGWKFDHFNGIQDAVDIVKNNGGIFVFPGTYRETVTINKSINLTGHSRDDTIIDAAGKTEQAIHINAEWVNTTRFKIMNSWDNAGIQINSPYSMIERCNILNNYYGIHLYSSNCSIKNCSIFNNSFKGIWLDESSNITLSNCDIYNNNEGIYMELSSNINVVNNSIFNNSFRGILMNQSWNNTIIYCNILDNTGYGIFIEGNKSVNSSIHHNNFIENQQQAYDESNNTWDNGSIGNYWSDYEGIDTDNDGIGDTPYNIPGGNNQDRYPLVNFVGQPLAYFSFTPTENITTQTNINFIDESIDLDGTITNWLWEFGDGSTSTDQNPTHRYADDGTYTVNLTVTDNDEFTSTTSKVIIVANVPPSVSFTYTLNGYLVDVDATNSTDSDGTIINYKWTWGDGNITYGVISNHTYAKDGTYTITLNITDDDGDTNETTVIIVFISPIANFSYSPTNPTDMQTIDFTDNSSDSDGKIMSWYWEFGDGTASTQRNPRHQYSDDGTYQVNLTVWDDDGNSDATSKNVTVSNVPPTADFTWMPTNPDTSDIIQFTDNSNDSDGAIASWFWEFGDGTASIAQNPAHRYADNGAYRVNLTVWDDDGTSGTISKNIIVSNVPPTADFTWTPTNPGTLDIIQFTDESIDLDGIIGEWLWDFGDGDTSREQNPTHQYSDDGNYPITLTVIDDDGANGTNQKIVTVEKRKVILVNDDFTDDPENHKWDTIQEGINDAANGDMVYVYEGIYNETIIVDRSIDLIGEEKNKVKIEGGGIEATVNISGDWVNMSGFTISNADDGGITINGINANISHCSIGSETYGIIINGVNADISDCTINSKTYGVLNTVYNEMGMSIYNCEIYNSMYGLNLTNSSGFILSNCTVHDTDWGIWFKQFSNVTIQNSIFHNSENKSILIDHSSEIIIEKCDLSDSFCGVGIRTGSNISINNSSIHDNLFGIRLSNSNYNIIMNSTISENNVYGIYIMNNSNNNSIHHNNLIDNINQAFPEQVWDNCNNTWDNGSVGNYWSDYEDIDDDKDGIGDTPYNIPGGNNQDLYPLMNLVGWPIAYFSFTPTENITTQTNINFTYEAIDLDGTIESWYWEFGDGSTSNQQNTTHQYADDGNYMVNLTVTDDDELTNTTSKVITVANVPPSASFTYTLNGYLVNVDATNSTDSDGTIINYKWTWGDGNISYEKISNHDYTKDGTYTITLNITDDDGDTNETATNITFISPIANFSYLPTHPTDMETINFTDNSSDSDGILVNWTWNFGDGNISWKQNATHKYADDGNYTVNLTVTDDANLTNTTSKIIKVVNVPPMANFTFSPKEPTDIDWINFTDNSTDPDGNIVNWTWDFGDGNISYGKNSSHQYGDNGTYQVNLTVWDDDGANDTISKNITVVNVPPIANFTWSPEFPTDRDIITFTDISKDPDGNIVNWTWDFGDGNATYGKNVSYQYADSGTYNVTLIVEDNDGDTNSSSKEIMVSNINPIAYFTWSPSNPKTDTAITFDASSSFDPDGTIQLYEWDWDNDGIYDDFITSPTVTHSWSDNGNYPVTLRVIDDDGANDTKTRTVTVENRPPIVDFTFTPSNPEPTETVSFKSNCHDPDGTIEKYSWSFGDGTSSSFSDPKHIYSNNGIYYVGLTVWDDDDASSTKWKTINVNIPPTADFTYSPAKPTDLDNITFKDSSIEEDGNIVSYKWEFGDGNTSRKQNATHRYADNGNYTVTLTIEDDNGATDKKSRNITVRNVIPIANFSYIPESPVKINTTLNFTDNSTDPDGYIVNWTWDFDDGTTAYGNQTNHTYLEGGDYDVILTVKDNDNDTDTYITTITVEKEKEKKEEGVPGFEFAFLIIAIALIALITLFRHRPNKPYRY